MKRIRKGDEVIVTTGRSKGTRGHVLQVLGEDRLLVENVNMVKRHTKPDPGRNKPGGIVEREAPIHISNVSVFNPATGKADRVGFKSLEDGNKVRVFKSTGEAVDI
jgi:large subunit ribosomal protein L24